MRPDDYARFEKTAAWMERKAEEWGLSPFPMRYEICPADVVYSIAGFGMPTRFTHWSFGKHYYRQKLDFDYGLSRIYELVVNNNPCYAFFLDSNTILQNEMIVAHVLGHSDFFRNNGRFMQTNRRMVETMAATAERFRKYEDRYGIERVEQIIDSALAIAEHVDPALDIGMVRGGAATAGSPANVRIDLDVDGTWNHDDENQDADGKWGRDADQDPNEGGYEAESSRDLLQFLVTHGAHLKGWERDIVASIRDEMLYFWPQMETKIMNEGWATYWHTRFMQEMDLTGEDAIEFAKLTASVSQTNRFQLNPYNVGLAIWRDIQSRYGEDEMFIVRESDSDTSFLRNYLTQDVVDQCDLYLYEKQGNEWIVVEKDVEVIREVLVRQRVHAGFPAFDVSIRQDDGRSVLTLTHAYEGTELDEGYVRKTLPHVYRLWGGQVSVITVVDEKSVEYVYDGTSTSLVRSA